MTDSLWHHELPYRLIVSNTFTFIMLMISQSPELSGTTWFNLSAIQIGLVVWFERYCYNTSTIVLETCSLISANNLM